MELNLLNELDGRVEALLKQLRHLESEKEKLNETSGRERAGFWGSQCAVTGIRPAAQPLQNADRKYTGSL